MKPLKMIPFFFRKSKHQLQLRGSSAANQGEDTIQCSAIVDTLHGIQLNKEAFSHTKNSQFCAENSIFLN